MAPCLKYTIKPTKNFLLEHKPKVSETTNFLDLLTKPTLHFNIAFREEIEIISHHENPSACFCILLPTAPVIDLLQAKSTRKCVYHCLLFATSSV